jgi:hypothetical protein
MIREGLKRLHPGKFIGLMMMGDAEFDDDDPVGDWFTRTGTSDWRVKWRLEKPAQKFWIWTSAGIKDFGNEDLENRTQEEVWSSLRRRNSFLRRYSEYQLFIGQNEVGWMDLPLVDLTVVLMVIPVGDRGVEFKLLDRNSVPRPREVGHLTRAAFQLFTAERTLIGDETTIDTPNEITLAQLVTSYILPMAGDRLTNS